MKSLSKSVASSSAPAQKIHATASRASNDKAARGRPFLDVPRPPVGPPVPPARPRPAADERFVGLDLGDTKIAYCVLDGDGILREADQLTADADAVAALTRRFPHAHALLEAGGHSPWVQRTLVAHGWVATVTKADILCGRRRRKSDPTDAAELAELLRLGSNRITPIEHKSEAMAADAAVVSARDALVGVRTALLNFVQGVLKSAGVAIPKHTADNAPRLLLPLVPPALKKALRPLLQELLQMNARLDAYDKAVKQLAAKYPAAQRLAAQVPGVSHLVASAFVLAVIRPERFVRARDVGPFFGLEPKEHSSGTLQPQLGISKAGNPLVRKRLVQSANYLLGPFAKAQECDLRRWGVALMARGGKGARKRAVIAVARKLAVTMLASWKSGADYDPDYRAKQRKAAAPDAPSNGAA